MIVEPVESAEVMVDSFLGSEFDVWTNASSKPWVAGYVFGLLLTIGMHPQENGGHIVFAQKFCGDRAGIAVAQLEVVQRKDFNSSLTMPRTPAKNSTRPASDET